MLYYQTLSKISCSRCLLILVPIARVQRIDLLWSVILPVFSFTSCPRWLRHYNGAALEVLRPIEKLVGISMLRSNISLKMQLQSRYFSTQMNGAWQNGNFWLHFIIIIMSCRLHGYPWPSLATSPNRLSPPAGLQGYIPYTHIAAVCMFELVVLFLLGHMWGSIGVHHLWAPLCFSSSVLRVWLVYLV